MAAQNTKARVRVETMPIVLAMLLPIYVLLFSFVFLSKNGADDALSFFLWWLTLFIFGLAAFPIASWLFSGFRSKGYGFSKALGILLASFFLWTFCYLRIIPFSRLFVILSLFFTAAISWSIPRLRKEALDNLSKPDNVYEMIGSEVLFASFLLILCFIKGIFPEINGEEKFMDFAFLNSLLRTETLPAPDPWLAGESINYYYYGQYIYAFLTKLNRIVPGAAYVLSMCTSIALPFSMAFSIGTMSYEGAIKNGLKSPSFLRYPVGLLSGLAVVVMGNAHSFFYDEKSIGNRILPFFEKMGAKIGSTDHFFYPNSTRYIGHNPDVKIISDAGEVIQHGDYTIHEFPFYSYLIGDLHAHVVSMMIVLLIIAVLFVLVHRNRAADRGGSRLLFFGDGSRKDAWKDAITYEFKRLLVPEIILTSVLLCLCTMCNYWDFLIYFVFSSMALFIYHSLSSKFSFAGSIAFMIQISLILGFYLRFSSQATVHAAVQVPVFIICALGAILLPSTLTRTGMGMSFLFTSAHILSLPFQSQFEMISNAIGLVKIRTAPYQFFIVWFVHLLFALLLIIAVICDGSPLAPKRAKRKPEYISLRDAAHFRDPVSRFLGTRNRSDIFMCGVAVVGILMLLAPEIIFVRDIYHGDYDRTNTMFKFTFAAFILLSLVLGYALFRIMMHTKKNGSRSGAFIFLSLILALLLFVPGHYPSVSVRQRTGEISMDRYQGLNGTHALRFRMSPHLPDGQNSMLSYARAIDYLNENVVGSHVICEAYGWSYTDSCVVSAYTGLPTIFGWYTHEWLWRFQGIWDEEAEELVQNPEKRSLWEDIIWPRHLAVDTIYTSEDEHLVRSYINQYQVRFIIVGNQERGRYESINDPMILKMGDIVFSTDDLYIVRVSPGSQN